MMNYIARLILVLFFVCGISCKKESQKAPEKKENVHVTEYKSHAPVPGADVIVVKISLDIFSNSAVATTVETLQTDTDGICPVPESYFKDPSYAIVVSKDGFWQSDLDLSATSIPTAYELQRKSQMRFHLIQLNSYPDDTFFYVESAGELPGYVIAPFTRVFLPADSTFSMDVFGGQTNEVHWARKHSFNAAMKTDFDPSIGKINIVPQDIGRVLLNLYNNTFYAVYEKKKQQSDGYEPTVFVSTRKIDGKVEISVRDNGEGVPQKIKDKIFQPFFTSKPTGQGTGLGLSLSYDIVKSHGGELKVASQDDKGAEVIVYLPII